MYGFFSILVLKKKKGQLSSDFKSLGWSHLSSDLLEKSRSKCE